MNTHTHLEDRIENVPCVSCGRTDLPLHVNRRCGDCGPEEPKCADYRAEFNGSLYLVRPYTAACQAWLEQVTGDEAQWFGGALVVEPRYFESLKQGLYDEGFRTLSEAS